MFFLGFKSELFPEDHDLKEDSKTSKRAHRDQDEGQRGLFDRKRGEIHACYRKNSFFFEVEVE